MKRPGPSVLWRASALAAILLLARADALAAGVGRRLPPEKRVLKDEVTGLSLTFLTTEHKMLPDHTHPIFSPDGKRILIQSGRLTDGNSLDLMVVDIPEALLKR